MVKARMGDIVTLPLFKKNVMVISNGIAGETSVACSWFTNGDMCTVGVDAKALLIYVGDKSRQIDDLEDKWERCDGVEE